MAVETVDGCWDDLQGMAWPVSVWVEGYRFVVFVGMALWCVWWLARGKSATGLPPGMWKGERDEEQNAVLVGDRGGALCDLGDCPGATSAAGALAGLLEKGDDDGRATSG